MVRGVGGGRLTFEGGDQSRTAIIRGNTVKLLYIVIITLVQERRQSAAAGGSHVVVVVVVEGWGFREIDNQRRLK